MIDAQTGLDYIRQRHDLRNTRIVLYGQSIGGAVTVALAARNQKQGDIAGIVLENTFTSLKKLIPRLVLGKSRNFLIDCRQRLPSCEISGPAMPSNLAHRNDDAADKRCTYPLHKRS